MTTKKSRHALAKVGLIGTICKTLGLYPPIKVLASCVFSFTYIERHAWKKLTLSTPVDHLAVSTVLVDHLAIS